MPTIRFMKTPPRRTFCSSKTARWREADLLLNERAMVSPDTCAVRKRESTIFPSCSQQATPSDRKLTASTKPVTARHFEQRKYNLLGG